MVDKIDRWYTFKGCQCTRYYKSLKTVWHKKYGEEEYSGYICPGHKTRVEERITYCVDCWRKIISEPKGSPPIRCTKHAKIQKEKVLKKKIDKRCKAQKKGGAIQYNKKDKNRGEYCTEVKLCYAGRAKPKCFTCMMFIPVFKNVDPAKWEKTFGGGI